MEKDIDFANTPICQSCGMPLTSPEQFGKNADGTANGDYCVYCCPDGEANMRGTLDEMIDFCAPLEVKLGLFPERTRPHRNALRSISADAQALDARELRIRPRICARP